MTDLHYLDNFLSSTDNSHKLIVLNFPKKTSLLLSDVLVTEATLNEPFEETHVAIVCINEAVKGILQFIFKLMHISGDFQITVYGPQMQHVFDYHRQWIKCVLQLVKTNAKCIYTAVSMQIFQRIF